MNVCTALMLLASLGNVSASFILQETFSAAGCAAADKKKRRIYTNRHMPSTVNLLR